MGKTDDNRIVKFDSVEHAVEVIKNRGMVIVMDDESRENEGDLIMAAEDVTPKQCAFIIRHTTGILCAPMPQNRAEELKLPRMVKKNQDPNGTAFTVTCDSIRTTTGVSAADRTLTFRELANPKHKADSFSRPGHIFPLIAKEKGVLERRGHTEASVDLCKLAGKYPVGVIGELTNDDGTMKRLYDCADFAEKYNIPLITVDEMVRYLNKKKKEDEEKEKEKKEEEGKVEEDEDTVVIKRRTRSSSFDGRKLALQNAIESVHKRAGCLPVPILRVVTDRHGRIVMTNDEFVKFTGYSRDLIFGRKCNFLQGKDTDPEDIADIRSALRVEEGCSVVLLNYTKSGSRFWNVLTIRPLMSKRTKQVLNYVGDIITIPIPDVASERIPSDDDMLKITTPSLHIDDVLSLLTAATSGIPRPLLQDRLEIEDITGVEDKSLELVEKPACVSVGYNLNYVASTMLPTSRGRYRIMAYRDAVTKKEPIAIVYGDVSNRTCLPVRVHDQCMTSEVFGSLRCDCKQQLNFALNEIRENGAGVVVYLPQEGRGIGIANKIAAYSLQEHGVDTVDANRKLGLPDDARTYECAQSILSHLKVKSVNLMTNNPRKLKCLRELGVKIEKRLPCVVEAPSKEAKHYMNTKATRMGHLFDGLR